MNYHLSRPRKDTVKLCKEDTCIEATGKNADLIAGAATLALLFFGIAALVNAAR